MNQSQTTNARRLHCGLYLLALLLGLALLLVACMQPGNGASNSAATDTLSDGDIVALAEFPGGIGRGYALASLEGIDNASDGAVGLQPGDLAPNFRFVLEGGGYSSLHELRGGPVVLNFWATWCGPCRREMPEFVDASQAHDDLVILAINVQETRETLAPFAEEFAITMPVIRDAKGELQNLYEIRGLPATLFIDRNGRIVQTWPGLLTGEKLDEFLAEIL